MRRSKAFKRGGVFSVVVAGFAGYVIGGWNGSIPHSAGAGLSAAQTVALRFPQDIDQASPTTAAAPVTTIGEQFALLNPQPMVPQAALAQVAAASTAQPTAQVQLASADATVALPVRPAPTKSVATTAHRASDRPGFILNDAQIASIKARLHLTPNQEEMWPAVEAALRNLVYAHTREARRRGAPANTQLASADANSTDVQDLKNAAIPLIMSFNTEQKDEVRSIAHVMGLDQLASQF